MQGIKFNQDGIRAILEGRKTMTRRPIKGDLQKAFATYKFIHEDHAKYKIGETVFVQEDYAYQTLEDKQEKYIVNSRINKLVYRAGHQCSEINYIWTNASTMTEKEARTFLKITNIKVERLQDISEDDCIKEGIQKFNDDVMGVTYSIYSNEEIKECIGTIGHDNHKLAFQCDIWDELPYQPPYRFEDNPFVFCYEFQRVENV